MLDQLATGVWTQMHDSTEGQVDWFIEGRARLTDYVRWKGFQRERERVV